MNFKASAIDSFVYMDIFLMSRQYLAPLMMTVTPIGWFKFEKILEMA